MSGRRWFGEAKDRKRRNVKQHRKLGKYLTARAQGLRDRERDRARKGKI